MIIIDENSLGKKNGNELRKNVVQYLPVGLFGSTVAYAGLAIALKQLAALYNFHTFYATAVAVLGWTVFVLLTIFYFIKFLLFPSAVREELKHPVTGNFLGTFFISAVLLAGLAAPHSILFARITWLAGTVGGLVFLCTLTSRLYKGALNVLDTVPPILIPGLTVLNAATSGDTMGFGWFGNKFDVILFSVGIAYVFVFFIVITYRLIHRSPVIEFLVPTLLLMSAPFTVGFICYLNIVSYIDLFGTVMFYFGFFVYAVLFFSVFKKGLHFMISWWGACFATGALTNSAFRYAIVGQDVMVKFMATGLFVGLVLMIAVTSYLTINRLVTGKLLKPASE
ncbi:hypothetical protein [Pedobacter rhodius]|uniref:C4-dicarboxylate ABC transporter n=1 Tax=Pedobacter rhodius TaxID=3004098 RepID=A0ABT4L1P1_9SPHI|nr:hypothetical protein [Pedobacter sp. SJ11]MCZ4225098.1 hypothetical protein [Pedobacter sp. SJ11]